MTARAADDTSGAGWMQKLTPIVAVSFASLLIGLLLPILAFGQRLAVQEERMRVTVEGVAEVRRSVESLGDKVGELRESLAAGTLQRRGK